MWDSQSAIYLPWQPAIIDLILDVCTRYPIQLGGLRKHGIENIA